MGLSTSFKHVMQPHQQNRILVSLGMKDDPSESWIHVSQSPDSHRLAGLRARASFIDPDQTLLRTRARDRLYLCTVAEEFGFFGSTIVVLIFLSSYFSAHTHR